MFEKTVSVIYCMSLCVQTKAFLFYIQFITYSMKGNLEGGGLPSKEKQTAAITLVPTENSVCNKKMWCIKS